MRREVSMRALFFLARVGPCLVFASALLGVGHGAIVAIMFVLALALLMTCLVNLALEIRIQLATIGLD